MKKYALYFIILILVLAFSGCGKVEHGFDETPDIKNAFEYEPEEEIYDRDPFEHWIIGKKGDKLEAGAHELDNKRTCTVCNSTITEHYDGAFEVTNYDQYGSLIRHSSYNADGTLIGENTAEFEYDELGNVLIEKHFTSLCDFIEITLYTYKTDSEGTLYVFSKDTTYGSGESLYYEYTENGNILYYCVFDPAGNLTYETINKYLTDENGEEYVSQIINYDLIYNNKSFFEFDKFGNLLLMEDINEAGESYRKEIYEYNEDGMLIHSYTYIYDLLAEEYFYDFAENENGIYIYCRKKVIHNDDGTGIIQLYNEKDELISEEKF
ncbi:MAG: hypothetical protein IKU42_06350 [Oscillospiraceae bacterium]|nr:hypothetical protein [Oscillospiraceae bacterium]